jgi:hypothetical protein
MAKKLGIGLGELDWGDDEAKLLVKFPRARRVSNRTSVNPATGQRTQTPDKLVVTDLVSGPDAAWEIELVDGRASRVVALVDIPEDDWQPVHDEMVDLLSGLVGAPVDLDGDDPDQTWQYDGATIELRVEGDCYVVAIAPTGA